MKRAIVFSLTFLSLAMFLSLGLAAVAPERDPPEMIRERAPSTLVPPLAKEVPETIEDFRTMEKQVEMVLEKVMPATVCIMQERSTGSGVIVSADGLILTAGHVSQVPGTLCKILLKDGKIVKAKSLGRQGNIDTGMVQITDKGPFPYVEIGTSAHMKPGQYCVAVGHPGGPKLDRGMVVRVGRVLFNSNGFMQSDCYLVGGDSGGPLFNMRGEVIGIHSRINNPTKMSANIHVPTDIFHQTWDRLVRGDSWGGGLGVPILVKSAEGKVIMEEKGEFTYKDPFDARMKLSHTRMYTFKMTPGFAYTIDMKSKKVDSYLRLESPGGTQIAADDDGGSTSDGPQDSRIVYRPARAGEYRIHATTFDGGQTGDYTLTIRQAEIVVKDLPTGKVKIVDALKHPQPALKQALGTLQKFGFEIFATATLLDEKGNPIAEKEAAFLWKAKRITSMSDDQGQVRVRTSDKEIDELMVEVPDGVKAMVRISDFDGNPLPLPGIDDAPKKKGKQVTSLENGNSSSPRPSLSKSALTICSTGRLALSANRD